MSARERFLACIERGVGVYRYCSPSVEGHCWDCSGYVAYCYGVATGQHITSDSHRQYELGRVVSGAIEPGDLLFYKTGFSYRGNAASHVGVFVGNDTMVNALNEDAGILESDIFSAYWKLRYLGARRWFDVDGSPLALGDVSQEPLVSPSIPSSQAGRRERNGERERGRLLRRMVDRVRRRRGQR